MDAQNENLEVFNKDLENIKNNQRDEDYNNRNEKNTLEGINSRLYENASVSRKTVVEITATEQKEEKRMKKKEYCLRDLWENIRHTNIQIIGVL